MKLEGAFFVLARMRGARVGMHLFVPVALLVTWAFDHSVWAMATMFALILVHEVGHAGLVWWFGARVLTIDVMPWGGECSWQGEVTPLQRALIAWGGVLAQAIVLVAALLAPPPESAIGFIVRSVLTGRNAWMMAFNLIPVPPLDGSKAWRAIPMWWRSRREELRRRREVSVVKDLERRNRLDTDEIPEEVRSAVSKLLEDARKPDPHD